ncbi:lipoyl domain-containing protein [Agrococcus jejuensis]|uniref:Biotin-requiring enzyme n=1 Tax=Agrococcus jejuensis TaxID=399736 RepID=A0A1G8B1Y6_9MICO|nr:lipoyl domain-containing protein [Agrococcus jejuensis]SDH27272.1 Biotin-requiring enzyme [Agrococcus jejuensis]
MDVVITRGLLGDETEGSLVMWHVPDGEHVAEGHPVAEVENSKAEIEVLAPATGVLRRTIAAGQPVREGQAIGRID